MGFDLLVKLFKIRGTDFVMFDESSHANDLHIMARPEPSPAAC
jgi:hypothetical protein